MGEPQLIPQVDVEITDSAIVVSERPAWDPGSGAVLDFVGVVRQVNEGKAVEAIEYQCYDELAVREIMAIVDEVSAEVAINSVRVIHRKGRVVIGEVSLLVSVGTAHRAQAFAASRKIVEALKSRVPIWKKECYRDGTSRWL